MKLIGKLLENYKKNKTETMTAQQCGEHSAFKPLTRDLMISYFSSLRML